MGWFGDPEDNQKAYMFRDELLVLKWNSAQIYSSPKSPRHLGFPKQTCLIILLLKSYILWSRIPSLIFSSSLHIRSEAMDNIPKEIAIAYRSRDSRCSTNPYQTRYKLEKEINTINGSPKQMLCYGYGTGSRLLSPGLGYLKTCLPRGPGFTSPMFCEGSPRFDVSPASNSYQSWLLLYQVLLSRWLSYR
jgi:hypothetical protein